MRDDDDDFEGSPTPGRPRRAPTRSRGRGVPVVMPEPIQEMTAPLELLLNGQLTEDDYAQAAALKRAAPDLSIAVLNLARAMARKFEEERSGSQEIEKAVRKAIADQAHQMERMIERTVTADGRANEHDRQLGELARRAEKLEETNVALVESSKDHTRKLSFAQKVAGFAIVLAIGSVGALVTKIWDRAGDEREVQVKMMYMQQELDRVSKHIEHESRKEP